VLQILSHDPMMLKPCVLLLVLHSHNLEFIKMKECYDMKLSSCCLALLCSEYQQTFTKPAYVEWGQLFDKYHEIDT